MTTLRVLLAPIFTLTLVSLLPAGNLTAQEAVHLRSTVDVPASAGIAAYRVVTTRDVANGRSSERTAVEGRSLNGAPIVLSAVQDDTVEVTTGRSRRTRQEFVTDTNGRRRLLATVEEHRVELPDEGQRIVREFTEPDVNGASRPTRSEREETVSRGGGRFSTTIEVSVAAGGIRGLVPTERIEQTEHRSGEQVVQLDRTTYANPTGRGHWEPQERRVMTRDQSAGRVQTVESVFRSDGRGNLVASDRIVSREWTSVGGREHRTETLFTRDIPNEVRTSALRLYQQVDVVRTNRSSGRSVTTRTVRETRNNRLQVVERVTERTRPDRRGGTVTDRETQRLDINGRLQTVDVSQTRESTM